GNLAWLHLSYAEELKDDMAVIDWSKNLEKLDSVRAFQVLSNSKIVAEGGNKNYLPSSVPQGVAYFFPSEWSFRVGSGKPQAPAEEFTLVLHLGPGPLLWGLFVFGACLAGGCAVGFFLKWGAPAPSHPAKSAPAEKASPSIPASSAETRAPAKSAVASLKKNTAYLFIDKDYVIRQISPEAASFFQKQPGELLNGHFLDLAPDPALIQAFEKSEETKVLKPFLSHLDLAAHLKPDSDGYLLVLERKSGSLSP
ncbi:MAG TPA: hypothetical protein VJ873_09380, partial [bacterium]|nr:hypothetical protein [bacterium]